MSALTLFAWGLYGACCWENDDSGATICYQQGVCYKFTSPAQNCLNAYYAQAYANAYGPTVVPITTQDSGYASYAQDTSGNEVCSANVNVYSGGCGGCYASCILGHCTGYQFYADQVSGGVCYGPSSPSCKSPTAPGTPY